MPQNNPAAKSKRTPWLLAIAPLSRTCRWAPLGQPLVPDAFKRFLVRTWNARGILAAVQGLDGHKHAGDMYVLRRGLDDRQPD
jgi:hypothetical protein